VLPLYTVQDLFSGHANKPLVLELEYSQLEDKVTEFLRNNREVVLLLTTRHANGVAEQRAFFMALANAGLTHPVIIHRQYGQSDNSFFQIAAAADTGMLFLDGFGDAISLAAPAMDPTVLIETHFGILQASRVRFSKTEFISCPGCGRTLFDLQTTTAKVRERTSHLKGLKIAIMGCIVNGIGEMADADYGYVGAGPGRISLFKNRELVLKNLPESEAVDRLIELIKEGGHWQEPDNLG
jgi:(E)-4-hydroxy-3-methylbut-2-enyl-diphosphate synthase